MKNPNQKNALEALRDFADCWNRRDLISLLGHLSEKRKTIMYGSGADEKLIGGNEIKQQIERDWQQSESACLDLIWNTIDISGGVAWISSDVKISAVVSSNKLIFAGRLTTVWEEEDYNWHLVQWHLSIPAESQKLGQSYPDQTH